MHQNEILIGIAVLMLVVGPLVFGFMGIIGPFEPSPGAIRRVNRWLGIGWSLLVCSSVAVNHPVNAEVPAAAEPPLEEILVVGEQPGPAMWRVTKGDHTLWILATLEPLPKNMVWHSKSVDERIAASQLVLSPPELSAHVGFFRSMTLVPSLLHARHAPTAHTFEPSLPPAF